MSAEDRQDQPLEEHAGDGERGGSDEYKSLYRYWRQVTDELARREANLMRIDDELRKLEYELARRGSTASVAHGDPARILAADSYRRRLRAEMRGKSEQRQEMLAEILRARERRDIAEKELEAFKSGEAPGQSED